MQAVDALSDRTYAAARKRMEKMAKKHPRWSDKRRQKSLDRWLKRRLATEGAIVGTAAAVPGIGTLAALALTGGQSIVGLAECSQYAFASAQLADIDVRNEDRRRTLVLAQIMGEDGAEVAASQLGVATFAWAKNALTRMPANTVKQVSQTLAKRAAKRGATATASRSFGRLMPFGIGIYLGWRSGKKIAKQSIASTRLALGHQE